MRLTLLTLLLLTAAASAPAQPPPQKTGLAAILADDDRVLSELVARDMQTLQQYLFKKDNIGPDQQAAYRAVGALRQLDNPKSGLSLLQQQQLIDSIARGIDKLLPTINRPDDLMKLGEAMDRVGATQPLNMLEYWGGNDRTRAQLRPVAEALVKVYAKAAQIADADSNRIEKQITAANQAQLGAQWQKASDIASTARYWAAYNHYVLALSIDPADKMRAAVCVAGIAAMKTFDDPAAFKVVAPARVITGKLFLAQGTADSCKLAREKFDQVLKDPAADWDQRFQAVYFSAVADLVLKDVPAAIQSADAVKQWVAKSPPQGGNAKEIDAALDMLGFRICCLQAEQATDPDVRKRADDAAMAVLQQLVAKRPELAALINERIVLRLPENPDLTGLSALLLKAMLDRGHTEILRDLASPVNKAAIMQAIAAAREIIRCAADADEPRHKDVTASDTQRSSLLLGFFYARLGSNLDAATTSLDFIDKYKGSTDRDRAFENAVVVIAALQTQPQPPSEFRDVYLRFLGVATAPPFSRKELCLTYAERLLQRNNTFIESGNYDETQRAKLIADARTAIEMLHQPSAQPALRARYFEMVAYDELVDLAGKTDDIRPWLKRVNELAEEVNKLVAEQLPQAKDDAARLQLRSYKARTAKLIAELAKHETGPEKEAALRWALAQLDDFRETIKEQPDADALLADMLRARIELKTSLGRSAEAVADLEEALKDVRTPEEALRLMTPLIKSLEDDFDRAEQRGDDQRMAELAMCLSKVSEYVVKRVEQSTDAKMRSLLPEFRRFKIGADLKAAKLMKDPAQRKSYYDSALAFYSQELQQARQAARANSAEAGREKAVEFQIARVQYDMGDPTNLELARKKLAELMQSQFFGVPINRQDGTQNDTYWEVTYKLLDCNARLLTGADLETTRRKLKELYILCDGQPGGPKWTREFDKLRKSLLPEWTPPTPARRPATRGDGVQD